MMKKNFVDFIIRLSLNTGKLNLAVKICFKYRCNCGIMSIDS